MKRLITLLCIAFALFRVEAYAAVLSDDYSALYEKQWSRYHNLSLSPGIDTEFGWEKAPDKTALSLSSPLVTGEALYAVSGAKNGKFSVYSTRCTIAAKWNDGYRLGGMLLGQNGSPLMRARLAASGVVCLQAPEGWREAVVMQSGIISFPERAFHPGATTGYGLTVSASADNKSFTELPLTISFVKYSMEDGADYACYYEIYTCDIPPEAGFIKLDLRDARGFRNAGGGYEENTAVGSLRFANAEFYGDAVKWGTLEEQNPNPPIPPTPSDSQTSGGADTGGGGDTTSDDSSNDSDSAGGGTSPNETSSDSISSDETSPDSTSSDETSSDETSDDTSSGFPIFSSGNDPDLQKPIHKPEKSSRRVEITVDNGSSASSKEKNPSRAKAESKAPPKAASKVIIAAAEPKAESSAEKEAVKPENPPEQSAPATQPWKGEKNEKRMAVAGTYIAGATFALAAAIRKP